MKNKAWRPYKNVNARNEEYTSTRRGAAKILTIPCIVKPRSSYPQAASSVFSRSAIVSAFVDSVKLSSPDLVVLGNKYSSRRVCALISASDVAGCAVFCRRGIQERKCNDQALQLTSSPIQHTSFGKLTPDTVYTAAATWT